MASEDKLVYFDVRARGEPTRMVYALAGKALKEDRVTFEQWPSIKEEQPLGQLPVFHCEEGKLLMSNTIARYAAKKFGLAGSNLWEETLCDLVVETCSDCFQDIPTKIYIWKVFKREPEPEDSAKKIEEVKAKISKGLGYIQSVAEKRGKKFLVCDTITVADAWLYSSLEFALMAFPDIMEWNAWIKEFVASFKADERMKKYLEGRPASAIGL